MYFFSITLVAATAAMTLFGFSALYSVSMGVPYFLDSEIPAGLLQDRVSGAAFADYRSLYLA